MLDETKPAMAGDGLASARERVRIGPVPSWVVSCPFDLQFKAKRTEQVTYLCLNRQVHADNRQTYVHAAMRLETMQAVQRESQWRLQYEPRSQSVTLHTIKIRRGDLELEHAKPEEFRLLQREEGLEGYVIDGWFTLLLVLEDVRPGDVLEWCYTIESQPGLLPQCCTAFFSLPGGIPVGKYAFAVKFTDTRAMKWKSSSSELKPVETRDQGQVLWVWEAESRDNPKPEEVAPPWYISYPWIQVSDCPDWRTVALAIEESWRADGEDANLAQIAKEIADKGPDPLQRIAGALELVQDHCRYLSVNLELGGHVPTQPGLVARRRFGDCKDLSFLLVNLLRRLGVPARPVLVNSTWRKSVAGMLPMPGLFNHVVVEFRVQDKTRWVDATMRHQGGGPLDRYIPDYGVGLPLEGNVSGLIEPPFAVPLGSYELKDSILLDTAGAPSLVAAVLTVRGFHAEALRQQIYQRGAEELARERLRFYTSRFTIARRLGEPELRDDRAANQLVLAEVFEINGFLAPGQTPHQCSVPLSNNLVSTTLPMVEQKPDGALRRAPLALPYPCNLLHIIEVQSPALQPFNTQRVGVESRFLRFSRNHKTAMGSWSATLTLSTLADAVPPEQIDDYRKTVEKVWQESMWSLLVAVGLPRPPRRRTFGQLPPLPNQRLPRTALSAGSQSSPPLGTSGAPMGHTDSPTATPHAAPSLTTTQGRASSSARRRRNRRRRTLGKLLWGLILGLILIGLGLLLFFTWRHDRQLGLVGAWGGKRWVVSATPPSAMPPPTNGPPLRRFHEPGLCGGIALEETQEQLRHLFAA